MKIAIDCANGAGYKAGPKLLRSLGAKVFHLEHLQMVSTLMIIVVLLFLKR